MRALVFSLVLAACGGSPKSASTPPPQEPPAPTTTSGPSCSAAVQAMMGAIHMNDAETRPKVASVFEARCTDDKWSDEARTCFGAIKTDGEIEGCIGKLTAEQKTALDNEMAKQAALERDKAAESQKVKSDQPTEAPKGTTRGATKKPKGGDPCMGGESDPCQGGQ